MNSAVIAAKDTFTAAPGSVVVVRDQKWLVTNIEKATDGWFAHVQGLSELVRDTEATFSTRDRRRCPPRPRMSVAGVRIRL